MEPDGLDIQKQARPVALPVPVRSASVSSTTCWPGSRPARRQVDPVDPGEVSYGAVAAAASGSLAPRLAAGSAAPIPIFHIRLIDN
jgi:hypothetical protein